MRYRPTPHVMPEEPSRDSGLLLMRCRRNAHAVPAELVEQTCGGRQSGSRRNASRTKKWAKRQPLKECMQQTRELQMRVDLSMSPDFKFASLNLYFADLYIADLYNAGETDSPRQGRLGLVTHVQGK